MGDAEDRENLPPGTLVGGRYQIVRRVRRGGMGVVYCARHRESGRLFAIKIIASELASRRDLQVRFLREARAAAVIEHRHVLVATDFGEAPGGGTYLVTEWLDGRDLCDELEEHTRLPAPRAVRIVQQVLSALEAAHELGVIHRDLKPENVFLIERDGDRDFVKVLDFGLARVRGSRLTQPGTLLGSPHYVSPEQARGDPIDERTDLYAIGCVLYELVTGQPPFQDRDQLEVVRMHLEQPVEPPSARVPSAGLPAALDAFLMKALAKDRAQRFASAGEMRRALEALAPALEPQPAPPAPAPETPRRPRSPASLDGATPLPPPARPSMWTGQHRRQAPTQPSRRVARRRQLLAVALGGALTLAGAAALHALGRTAPPAPAVAAPSPPPTPRPPPRAHLRVTSAPPGAVVLVDDRPAGVSPTDLELEAAPHLVRLEKPGFQPHVARLALDADRELSVELAPLPPPRPRAAAPHPASAAGDLPPLRNPF